MRWFNPEFEMTIKVTFVTYDDINVRDLINIKDLMTDVPKALSDALADTLEGEALAVTGAVKSVAVDVTNMAYKEQEWT